MTFKPKCEWYPSPNFNPNYAARQQADVSACWETVSEASADVGGVRVSSLDSPRLTPSLTLWYLIGSIRIPVMTSERGGDKTEKMSREFLMRKYDRKLYTSLLEKSHLLISPRSALLHMWMDFFQHKHLFVSFIFLVCSGDRRQGIEEHWRSWTEGSAAKGNWGAMNWEKNNQYHI